MTLREIRSRAKDNSVPDEDRPPSVGKFKGAILGCALGDAVGAWAERKPTKAARKYIEECVLTFDFSSIGKHHSGSQFGQYTDDTQLTRELALSIVDEGAFVPEDFALRICRMFDQNLIVGGGRATAEAAQRLKAGTPWNESGTPPPAAGNGAAMRAAPIGLLNWNDTDRLLQDANDQAIITHTAEMSVAGSVAIAMATAMCLNASEHTSSPREPGWWAWLARFVGRSSESLAKDIVTLSKEVFTGRKQRQIRPGQPEERDAVLAWLLTDDDPSWEGVSPWARSSVLWSLYSLAAYPDNLWEAIACAIWPGGDVDTTAAMTGALVGAHIGIERFPEQVLDGVLPQLSDARSPQWDQRGLERLAEQLHSVVTGAPPPSTETEDVEEESPVLSMFGKEE